MIRLFGMLIASLAAFYALTYAGHVWQKEHNPLGALAVTVLALADVGVSFYLLYLHM